MKRFTADNTQGYLKAELDWLNYQFEKAVWAEVKSWDHESPEYLDWQSGLEDEHSPQHIEWISRLAEETITDYDDEFDVDSAISILGQEAARAGDGSVVLLCGLALEGNTSAKEKCLEIIFETKKRAGE
jgi:hypothetical protein